MSIYVRYLYPVYAEVVPEAGEVLRVVVDDERPIGSREVLDDSFAPMAGASREAGRGVAETAMWPRWEFGW